MWVTIRASNPGLVSIRHSLDGCRILGSTGASRQLTGAIRIGAAIVLKLLKGVVVGDYIGDCYGVGAFKGDTRSSDYGTYSV